MPHVRFTNEERAARKRESSRRRNAEVTHLFDGIYIQSIKAEGEGFEPTRGDNRGLFNLGNGCRRVIPRRIA